MKNQIKTSVAASIAEDVGDGDVTAQLIDASTQATATVITRESAVICGVEWFNEVFYQVDPQVKISWHVRDGDHVKPNQVLVNLSGNARSLVTAERCALNWLQTLSGTATTVAEYVAAISNTKAALLDTRKTIPGLRFAQKYAVKIGGGKNHRMGLYDAYLIKENHIESCGSIAKAINVAHKLQPNKPVEVEVESLLELQKAIEAGADIIMLDNFDLEQMREAVQINQHKAKLEVSGNVTLNTIAEIASTGIDYISVGSLTKHLTAVDLSMRLTFQV